MVQQSADNPNIAGSNPATATGIEWLMKKVENFNAAFFYKKKIYYWKVFVEFGLDDGLARKLFKSGFFCFETPFVEFLKLKKLTMGKFYKTF